MSENEARLAEELKLAHFEIRFLKQKLDVLTRRLFGSSSERINPAQTQLLFEGLEEIATADSTAALDVEREIPRASKDRGVRGPRLPEHLPVREIIIDPEEVKADPEDWTCIGEEVSERLDYTPASFVRIRTVRRKYVRKERRDLPPV